MTDSLFQQAATGGAAPAGSMDNQPSGNDSLQDLVGEGKKYATEQDALASIPHAQTHIAKLEAENARLAAEAAKGTTVNEMLDQLKARDAATGEQQAAAGAGIPAQAPAAAPSPAASAEDLTTQVTEIVQKVRADEQAQANYAQFEAKLVEKYGANSAAELTALSNRVGMSLNDLQDLAQRSPTALLSMFPQGTTQQAPVGAGQQGVAQVRQGNSADSSTERTFSHYEQIRKADPKAYWSAKTQQAIHADAQRLGEAFYNS